jgi:hypothetical protein
MDMPQLGGDDLHAAAEVQRPANSARRTVGQRSKLLLLQLDPHNSIANAKRLVLVVTLLHHGAVAFAGRSLVTTYRADTCCT